MDEPLEFVRVRSTLPTLPLPPHAARPPIFTSRLALRPLVPDDLQPLHALRTQPEAMMWSVAGRVDADLEETRASLQQNLPPNDATNYNVAICLQSTGEWIGIGGVKTVSPGELGWPEIGYMFLKDHWGCGYATEFMRAYLDAWWSLPRSAMETDAERAFAGGAGGGGGGPGTTSVHDGDVVEEMLTAVTAVENLASQKMLLKLGYKRLKEWKEKDERLPSNQATLEYDATPQITMTQLGLANNIATATGLLGCAWYAGAVQSLSIFSIPAILETTSEPSHALKLWQAIYWRGHALGPRVAAVTCLSLAYSAYDRHSRGLAWRAFAVAGLLGLSIVPYTRLLMAPTNDKMLAGAQGLAALEWPETRSLLARWQVLNFARSFFHIAGAAVCLWFTAFQ
ncbi:Monooxygenase hypC [Colletotrichum trifolii]|uniref:Monooxygenase hypC n=1 Tax=Colletotrichum trifolii TaxID=5466 RepID=A0A4R8RJT1_COLTR|nr:Monooxygenase hypC [Colletotrichum trifolii]